MKNTSFTADIIKLLVITTLIFTAQTSYAQEFFSNITATKGSPLVE